jgi:siroheme synthase
MAERLLREALAEPHRALAGKVMLLRGDGPAERLTLKAARALAEADVVMADGAVTPDILALARRDAERFESTAPDALAALARTRKVLRVVAGPVETLAGELVRAGAPVEILPVA